MRSLEEILAELNAAEKEYAEKCVAYGIVEKTRKKKEEAPVTSEETAVNSQVEEKAEKEA